MSRTALYGKRDNQKYYRLITVTLDGYAASSQGRALKESGAVSVWFTKRFDAGQDIPDRYERVPFLHNQKSK